MRRRNHFRQALHRRSVGLARRGTDQRGRARRRPGRPRGAGGLRRAFAQWVRRGRMAFRWYILRALRLWWGQGLLGRFGLRPAPSPPMPPSSSGQGR
nr:MAG: hypothetical protein DIU70_00925 [Bacillota bacterium]